MSSIRENVLFMYWNFTKFASFQFSLANNMRYRKSHSFQEKNVFFYFCWFKKQSYHFYFGKTHMKVIFAKVLDEKTLLSQKQTFRWDSPRITLLGNSPIFPGKLESSLQSSPESGEGKVSRNFETLRMNTPIRIFEYMLYNFLAFFEKKCRFLIRTLHRCQ